MVVEGLSFFSAWCLGPDQQVPVRWRSGSHNHGIEKDLLICEGLPNVCRGQCWMVPDAEDGGVLG